MSAQTDGQWLQQMQAQDIAAAGSLVTLADGVTQRPAMYLTDMRSIQKYLQPDGGGEGGRGMIVCVFVFDGTVYAEGLIRVGDTLTFEGVKYSVEEPFYQSLVGGVCVDFAVPCGIF